MDVAKDAVQQWIAERARPLDDAAALAGIVGDAAVVGLGAGTHGSHELSLMAGTLLRVLVGDLGFRTLVLEETPLAGGRVDHFLQTGEGDGRSALAELASHHRTAEVADIAGWLRAWNEAHATDPVRCAGIDLEADEHVDGDRIAYTEPRLAGNIVDAHDRWGGRIVYWGGFSHNAVGDARTVTVADRTATHRNAGSHLRERFGAGYVAIGLTFLEGVVDPGPGGPGRAAVPVPGEAFVEDVLGAAQDATRAVPDPYLVGLPDVRAAGDRVPAAVRAWIDAPARLRVVGPWYDPAAGDEFHMTGGSLGGWFDAVAHVRRSTAVTLLG